MVLSASCAPTTLNSDRSKARHREHRSETSPGFFCHSLHGDYISIARVFHALRPRVEGVSSPGPNAGAAALTPYGMRPDGQAIRPRNSGVRLLSDKGRAQPASESGCGLRAETVPIAHMTLVSIAAARRREIFPQTVGH